MEKTSGNMTNTVINPSNTETCPSFQQVYAQCQPMIRRIIRHLENKHGFQIDDVRDMEQDGYEAMLNAMSHFDEERPMAFNSYLFKSVYYAVYNSFIAEVEHFLQHEYYDEYLPSEDQDVVENRWSLVPADRVYETDFDIMSRAAREDCEWLLQRTLNEVDQEIVRQRYGLTDGFESSFQAIGYNLGMSSERVRQRLNRAMDLLLPAA